MLSATTRVIVYDSSSLKSELLATGLECFRRLDSNSKCANNLDFLVDLLLSIGSELGGSHLRYQHERQRHFLAKHCARAFTDYPLFSYYRKAAVTE